ncbi:MAG TPA: bacillithiol biosynthesis deacetylase BshB1 [Thermoanaerobaculia bacterium]|nr:bacillithiol biosynthesis deacetylase BshB1 [Thermoanaerobaculia bacterium]
MKEVDLLFFGAHPDDVELAAGGTIARAAADGVRVGMIDLTRGEMGTRGTPAIRKREAQAAARALGASFRDQLDFGDGVLRNGRDEELEIIEIIRRTRPSLVFAPYPDDRHPDHTRTGQLVTDAWFYAGLRQLKTESAAHRPQTVIYYMQNYMVPPTFVVDTTATWKQKMKSIAAYKSQFHDPKSKEPRTFISEPSFLEMIDARGRHFGVLIGAKYGEAFVTKQPPRIDDLVAAYRGREV